MTVTGETTTTSEATDSAGTTEKYRSNHNQNPYDERNGGRGNNFQQSDFRGVRGGGRFRGNQRFQRGRGGFAARATMPMKSIVAIIAIILALVPLASASEMFKCARLPQGRITWKCRNSSHAYRLTLQMRQMLPSKFSFRE